MALHSDVHLWTAQNGQERIPGIFQDASTGNVFTLCDITALSYAIDSEWLAIARHDGLVQVFPRITGTIGTPVRLHFSGDIACLLFKPSKTTSTPAAEDAKSVTLLVGDNIGRIHTIKLAQLQPQHIDTPVSCSRGLVYSGHTEQIT